MKQNDIFKTQFLKIFINFKLPNRPKLQIVLCDLYKMTLLFAFSSSYSKKVHIIIRSSREKVRQKEAQIRDVNCPHVFFFVFFFSSASAAEQNGVKFFKRSHLRFLSVHPLFQEICMGKVNVKTYRYPGGAEGRK